MSPSAIGLAILLSTPGAGDATPNPRSPALQDPAPAPVYPQWTGALTLGASWTDGNTESANINGAFNAQRRAEKDRWTFDLFGNYGETTDRVTDVKDVTSNNSGGGVKYDYFCSKKVYLLGNGSGKVDHVATLDLRYVLGAGVGCQWWETEKVKWGTEVGLSYVDEDFEDDAGDADFVAARLASNLTYQLSKTSAFEQVAELLPSLEDSEDVIAKFDNRLKLNITGKWIAQIQYVLDFDGSTPNGVEETDHRVVLSLGWSLGS